MFDRRITSYKLAPVPRTPDELEAELHEVAMLREAEALRITLEDSKRIRLRNEARALQAAQEAFDKRQSVRGIPARLVRSLVELVREVRRG